MSRNSKAKSHQKRALNAYVKLARAANTAMAYARVGLEDADLTLSQFAVLEALYHLGPLNLGDLARRILTSSGNLTLVIDNLEKRGLAKRRQQGNDKRFIMASITPAGRKLIARIFPQHSRRIVEIMARLTSAEQEQLGRLCRKLGTGEE
ncbi:MAG TPA: MarR family transcriptional regulator [Candidatus Angelobacter sp.]|nr:MarR family transcriptional regulator [Candidatus Angelobacter sp.]